MSKRRRRKQLSQLAPDGLPLPLRWRPRVRIFGLISGAIGGLGAVVLVQQYGIAPLGRALTLQGLIGGAIAGIVVPSVVFAFVVRRYNRKLAEARERLPGGPAASPGVGAAVLFVMLLGTFTAFGAGAAYAEGQGPCRLTVEGRDVAGLRLTASDAILVESESSFIASMSWPSDFASFEVRFFYAGFSYGFGDSEVDEDVSDGGADSGTVELPVDLFFQYAGGLYEVHVDGVLVNGQSCNFAMLFDVDRNPLDTVIGKVALGTAAVGAIGVLGVGTAAAVDGARTIGDLTSMLSDIPGSVFDPTGVAVDADGVKDAAEPAGHAAPDRVEPAGRTAPEPRVVTDAATPAPEPAPGPKATPDAAEPAGAEPKVTPDAAEPAGAEPKVAPDAPGPAGKAGPEPKVAPGIGEPVADAAREPEVAPDAAEPAAGSAPRPTDGPVEPVGGDAAPDGAVIESAGPGPSEPAVTDPPPAAGTAAVTDVPGGESTAGEVSPPDLTFVEPSEAATLEPTGGVSGGKVGMAAAAVLTPALLGSLERTAKGRSSGAAPTAAPFWFYVTRSTPLFGLSDYGTIVGELSPGTWYLAQGTYGEWVHAVDRATNVQGWVAAQAALPAP